MSIVPFVTKCTKLFLSSIKNKKGYLSLQPKLTKMFISIPVAQVLPFTTLKVVFSKHLYDWYEYCSLCDKVYKAYSRLSIRKNLGRVSRALSPKPQLKERKGEKTVLNACSSLEPDTKIWFSILIFLPVWFIHLTLRSSHKKNNVRLIVYQWRKIRKDKN